MTLPKPNLCLIDRLLRGCIAIALILYTLLCYDEIGDPLLASLIFIFSSLNLVSFISAWCPVYHLANISTSHSK